MISQTSHKHADKVLNAMREAMKDVPKEYHVSVVAIIYRTVGERYHKK